MLKIKGTTIRGEYLVSLATKLGAEDECKLSYKCDEAHLRHILREIISELSVAEILKVLA
jgi:hypothetical protein